MCGISIHGLMEVNSMFIKDQLFNNPHANRLIVLASTSKTIESNTITSKAKKTYKTTKVGASVYIISPIRSHTILNIF